MSSDTTVPAWLSTLPPRPGITSTPAERATFWHAYFAAYEASGLQPSAFFELTGTSKASFYTWRKKLKVRAVQAAASPPAAVSSAMPSFVEITVASDPPVGMKAAATPLAQTTRAASACSSSAVHADQPAMAWLAELTRLSAALHTHLAGGLR